MSSRFVVSFGNHVFSLDPEWMLGRSFCTSGWKCRVEGEWLAWADDPLLHVHTADDTVQHFHGTTLSQAREIHEEGFRVSARAHGCPPGIWGITSRCFPDYARGHALQRAKLDLGWLEPPISGADMWLNGWNCPVVLALRLPGDQMRKVREIGQPPVSVQCFKGDGELQHDQIFMLAGRRHHFEVHIHVPTFWNYLQAPAEYEAVRNGTKVMCQCRLKEPLDVLQGGRNRDVSCGAVAVHPPPEDWHFSGRNHWICPRCDAAHTAQVPFSCRPLTETQLTCQIQRPVPALTLRELRRLDGIARPALT